ncbi:MAG TPA: retropepsin-like aspartic protease [Gemmatimonadaceae bacterium]|nr:retropepsin-like aspartic protease [Gemmatimonadaceae bacterium]
MAGVLVVTLVCGACDGLASPTRATVQADTAAGQVPLRVAGRGGAVLMVATHINGTGPYNLVLDTGATLTCLDERLVRQLALPRKTGAIGLGAGVGGSGRVALVQVDSVRLGSATVRSLTACVLDLSHLHELGAGGVSGLLGLNFLTAFHVTLDFKQRIMTLTTR